MNSLIYVIGSRLPLLVDKRIVLTLLVSIHTEAYNLTKRERPLSFRQADMLCNELSRFITAKRSQTLPILCHTPNGMRCKGTQFY